MYKNNEFTKFYQKNIINCSDDIYRLFVTSENNLFDKIINRNVKITVCIMTYNEERCIERCIKSVINFADEVVVVDTGSTDGTCSIIKKIFPSTNLYLYEWENNFSYIRNELIKLSTNEWIIQLDADEYFADESKESLIALINILDSFDLSPKVISPQIIDHDLHKTNYTKRILKKNKGLKYHGLIHEELRYYDSIDIPYILIKNIIYHDGYKPEIIKNKNKYLRNYNLLKKMILLEPKNIRWYYFLGREAELLGLDKNEINSILKQGLEHVDSDLDHFSVGILIKLIETNLDDENFSLKKISEVKRDFPYCIDSYFYELLIEYNDLIKKMSNNLKNSINKINSINSPLSFINSNLDHVLELWGWMFISCRNYEIAFLFFNKIKSNNIRNQILEEFKGVNEYINLFSDK